MAAAANGEGGLVSFAIQREWTDDVVRWLRSVGSFVARHLGEKAEETLPDLMTPIPPDTGKPRHVRNIDTMEPSLRAALAELLDLQTTLGVSRNVSVLPPPAARFAELRASGLVELPVIDGHARDMKDPKSPKQLADAIGAAKELTEATLRAALDRVTVAWAANDGLPQLMKKWRQATEAVASPDPLAQGSLDKAQAALGNVVTFVAEWRNAYGSGHGKAKFPPGLRPRHARLAADAAETAIRFIATTMDDLALLAPTS
jgi:hypothetical protein